MLVDARGLSCPLPVVEAKKAVASGEGTIEFLLDNPTPIANVTRYMKSHDYQCQATEPQDDGSTKLTFKK
ncbi:MAG: sulfurtransferase TusA family protein [Pyramidobacter sp.]|jgi:tRNA 2-thiouridine synthesizing protein A